MSEQTVNIAPWEQLDRIIDSDNVEHLETFLHLLPPEDTAYTLSHLEEEQLSKLILSVRPELAAQLIMHLADAQAADVIEELPPQPAAAIVDELGSDDQADVLAGMDAQDAEAILTHMDPREAADARRLVAHEPDTAGGIMITEYLAFTTDRSVAGVLADLRHNVDEYAQYDVQYVYVTDAHGALRGNVRLRDLVLAPGDLPLDQIMRTDPVSVDVSDELEVLDSVFDRHPFEALPVVDDDGRLVGVVHRAAVEEAYGEESDRALMRFGGIIGGEELRSMRLLSRGLRRFAFLVPNIVLLLLSISVIWAFEAVVLAKVTALFMFLPLVVGLSGCAGNQAVAVSIRELSLGLAKPGDVKRVIWKELQIGVPNGLALGLLVFISVLLLRSNVALAIVVGGAVPLTIVFSVLLGGAVPLVLKKVHIDPAMAAAPIITTMVDLFGFFVVLGFAYLMLDALQALPDG